MKTWAGYAEENKEYNGRAYVYTPVLPESAEKFEIAEIELPEIYVLVGDAGLATMALGETCNLNENYLVINSTNVSQYDEKQLLVHIIRRREFLIIQESKAVS